MLKIFNVVIFVHYRRLRSQVCEENTNSTTKVNLVIHYYHYSNRQFEISGAKSGNTSCETRQVVDSSLSIGKTYINNRTEASYLTRYLKPYTGTAHDATISTQY